MSFKFQETLKQAKCTKVQMIKGYKRTQNFQGQKQARSKVTILVIEFELTFPIVYVIRVTHRTVMTPKTKEQKPFRGYRLTNWETISHPIVVCESYIVQNHI